MATLFLRFLIVFLALLVNATHGAEVSFVLNDDHESFDWRQKANHPNPSFRKALTWTLHEQVGIGNALGGFADALQDCLIEDRQLIIHSVILQKFCEILKCSTHEVTEGDGFEEQKGDDMVRASHFHYDIHLKTNSPKYKEMQPIYEACSCQSPPSAHTEDADSWPHMCIYSNLIRSLILGPNDRLLQGKDWIHKYYHGNPDRFDAVMTVDKHRPTPVYDATIHIRTLALIEDMSTEDGIPENLEEKTNSFLKSEGFEAMVQCFATELSGLAIGEEEGQSVLSVYLATDAAGIREEFASQLIVATEKILNMKGVENCKVEVDFFKESLPPAHFFIWTHHLKDMTQDDWQRLAGTTAEWLFLSQGQKMLTVKGVHGGEQALPSSFALSAAAFGQVSQVQYLRHVSLSGDGDSDTKRIRGGRRHRSCGWMEIAYFS